MIFLSIALIIVMEAASQPAVVRISSTEPSMQSSVGEYEFSAEIACYQRITPSTEFVTSSGGDDRFLWENEYGRWVIGRKLSDVGSSKSAIAISKAASPTPLELSFRVYAGDGTWPTDSTMMVTDVTTEVAERRARFASEEASREAEREKAALERTRKEAQAAAEALETAAALQAKRDKEAAEKAALEAGLRNIRQSKLDLIERERAATRAEKEAEVARLKAEEEAEVARAEEEKRVANARAAAEELAEAQRALAEAEAKQAAEEEAARVKEEAERAALAKARAEAEAAQEMERRKSQEAADLLEAAAARAEEAAAAAAAAAKAAEVSEKLALRQAVRDELFTSVHEEPTAVPSKLLASLGSEAYASLLSEAKRRFQEKQKLAAAASPAGQKQAAGGGEGAPGAREGAPSPSWGGSRGIDELRAQAEEAAARSRQAEAVAREASGEAARAAAAAAAAILRAPIPGEAQLTGGDPPTAQAAESSEASSTPPPPPSKGEGESGVQQDETPLLPPQPAAPASSSSSSSSNSIPPRVMAYRVSTELQREEVQGAVGIYVWEGAFFHNYPAYELQATPSEAALPKAQRKKLFLYRTAKGPWSITNSEVKMKRSKASIVSSDPSSHSPAGLSYNFLVALSDKGASAETRWPRDPSFTVEAVPWETDEEEEEEPDVPDADSSQ